MAEIIKTYKQSVKALRFIGKKYGNADRVNGGFGAKWDEWHHNGWFGLVEKQIDTHIREIYEDGDAYLGLMREKDGEPFEYWIGMFMPEGTPVPEGFAHVDFPESKLGVCWIYGKDSEVFFLEGECAEKLAAEGIKYTLDDKGACWFFERYCCPRFTAPDEKGNIILDICFYVE